MRVTNHIFWTQGLKSGDKGYSACFNAGQDKVSSWVGTHINRLRGSNVPSQAMVILTKNKTFCPLTPNHSQQQ